MGNGTLLAYAASKSFRILRSLQPMRCHRCCCISLTLARLTSSWKLKVITPAAREALGSLLILAHLTAYRLIRLHEQPLGQRLVKLSEIRDLSSVAEVHATLKMGNAVTTLIGGLGRHKKASDFLDEKLVSLVLIALLGLDGSICTLHLELQHFSVLA